MSEAGDTIDINSDDLNKLVDNPENYKDWLIEILNNDRSKLAKKVLNKLQLNEIDPELDMLLRNLGNIIPYNILIPMLRDQLGLSIQTDKDCVSSLLGIKSHLIEENDIEMINKIINFIEHEDAVLDEDVIPEIDMLCLLDQIPVEKYSNIYNCIDYITEICEDI